MIRRALHTYGFSLIPRRFQLSCTCVAFALLLMGCSSFSTTSTSPSPSTSTKSSNPSTTHTSPATSTPTTTPSNSSSTTDNLPAPSSGYSVKVFFSKHPASDAQSTAVFPVTRTASTLGVGTFAINNLIQGPNSTEQGEGYYSALHDALSGSSTCGADFQLTLNTKGYTPETGTATLRFCRPISSAGIGTDARIQSEITQTLLQFPSIKKVVIITNEGSCFGDESGLNRCLS